MVGEQCQLVVGDEIPRDGFTVVRTEKLCRGMPQLAGFIWSCFIQFILKFHIPLVDDRIECRIICNVIEIERFAGAENSRVLREVSVIRVVEAIYKAKK